MNLVHSIVNPLTPNDPYRGRTAPLTSKVAFYIFIQQIQVLNILNMVYTLSFFPLENAASLIFLTYLVPVLLTFYIQDVPKLKKNSGAKSLIHKFLFFLISLLYSCTCFEHCYADHQEVKLYYTAPGIVTLCRWPSGAHRKFL